MPGVSITQPPSVSGSISLNVVVCIPVLWASEISAVLSSAPGTMKLSMVLFPTPLLPLKSVILSFSSGNRRSMPSFVSADTFKQS